MLSGLERLAEERIRDAIEGGELDDLPGAGRPLVLDDDALVPQELRAAYRVLRNAGFVPEEVRLRGEIATVMSLLESAGDGEEHLRGLKRLEVLRMRLGSRPGGERWLALDDRYRQRTVETLARS